jgi:hypothetical protein
VITISVTVDCSVLAWMPIEYGPLESFTADETENYQPTREMSDDVNGQSLTPYCGLANIVYHISDTGINGFT